VLTYEKPAFIALIMIVGHDCMQHVGGREAKRTKIQLLTTVRLQNSAPYFYPPKAINTGIS